ncbi:unnamed protein product, partial [Hydatigera taeniaeformis]|uniref:Uncharacterized protein n=1 Tax=Hydatigena taeniaeformis TaxID=6205 RepID=A0A0R3WWE7_HYDTA
MPSSLTQLSKQLREELLHRMNLSLLSLQSRPRTAPQFTTPPMNFGLLPTPGAVSSHYPTWSPAMPCKAVEEKAFLPSFPTKRMRVTPVRTSHRCIMPSAIRLYQPCGLRGATEPASWYHQQRNSSLSRLTRAHTGGSYASELAIGTALTDE